MPNSVTTDGPTQEMRTRLTAIQRSNSVATEDLMLKLTNCDIPYVLYYLKTKKISHEGGWEEKKFFVFKPYLLVTIKDS